MASLLRLLCLRLVTDRRLPLPEFITGISRLSGLIAEKSQDSVVSCDGYEKKKKKEHQIIAVITVLPCVGGILSDTLGLKNSAVQPLTFASLKYCINMYH